MSNNLTPEILERYLELALWYGEPSAKEIIERLVSAEAAVARVEALAAGLHEYASVYLEHTNPDRHDYGLMTSMAADKRHWAAVIRRALEGDAS